MTNDIEGKVDSILKSYYGCSTHPKCIEEILALTNKADLDEKEVLGWIRCEPFEDYQDGKISKAKLCEIISKAICSHFSKPKVVEVSSNCKYAVISHGLGISGKVEEIKVHCKMTPENSYTESPK